MTEPKRGDQVWVVGGPWSGCRAEVVELLRTKVRVRLVEEERPFVVDVFLTELSPTRPR